MNLKSMRFVPGSIISAEVLMKEFGVSREVAEIMILKMCAAGEIDLIPRPDDVSISLPWNKKNGEDELKN